MKVYLDLVGCRLNQAEIERYASQFRLAGHTLVPDPKDANLAVINTCAVTNAAESDSRQKIRQMARSGVEQIIATGCWATLRNEEAAALTAACHVVPNQQKDDLVPDFLGRQLPLQPSTTNKNPEFLTQAAVEKTDTRQPIPGARLRTRAFIKIQDGCDNRCTFCIATLARGPARSRSVEEILSDVETATGVKEVVLTGLHLGSWGQDLSPALHLRHLVQTLLAQTDIPRLRLSSLEPWELEPELIQLWENQRLCQHLHLPLQSGSASTLHRMARKTSPESFSKLVALVRSAVPEIAITTDIITGFPGENEGEFQESLAFVKSIQFAGGHVFTYSARPGTAAASMPDQVPYTIRKERNALMQAVVKEASQAYQASFINRILPVLWESSTSLDEQHFEMSGLTGNYLRVNAHASHNLWNQITPARLNVPVDGFIKGTILQE